MTNPAQPAEMLLHRMNLKVVELVLSGAAKDLKGGAMNIVQVIARLHCEEKKSKFCFLVNVAGKQTAL